MKKTYEELLRSEEWRNKRKEILSRDNNTCQHCGFSESHFYSAHVLSIDKQTFKEIQPLMDISTVVPNVAVVQCSIERKTFMFKRSFDTILTEKENEYSIVINF